MPTMFPFYFSFFLIHLSLFLSPPLLSRSPSHMCTTHVLLFKPQLTCFAADESTMDIVSGRYNNKDYNTGILAGKVNLLIHFTLNTILFFFKSKDNFILNIRRTPVGVNISNRKSLLHLNKRSLV